MAQVSIHEGKCGPCYLCGKDSTKCVHLAAKSDGDAAELINKQEPPPMRHVLSCSRNVNNPK